MPIMPAAGRTLRLLATTATLAALGLVTACEGGEDVTGVVARRDRSSNCVFFCTKKHALVIRSGRRMTRISVPEQVWKDCPPKSAYPACKRKRHK